MNLTVLAASEGMPPGLLWAGLGLLILSLILPRLMIRHRAPGKSASTPISREREQEVRRTLDDVFLQLQEFSREALAKLDTRIRMLNQLIVDADDRIRKLQSMPRPPATGEDAARTTGVAAAPAPASPPPPPPPPRNPVHERIWRLLDGGASISEVSREVGLPKGEVELIAGLRSLPERTA